MVALAWALPNWQHLTIAAGAVNAAALLLYPVIPESARWLLSQGKEEEATRLMQRIAACNGSNMPGVPLRRTKEFITEASNDEESYSSHSRSGSSAETDPAAAPAAPQAVGLVAILKNRSLLVRSAILLITWYSLIQVGNKVQG